MEIRAAGGTMNAGTYIADIRKDLLQARKQRDAIKSQVLLAVLNAIDNASAVDISAHPDVTEVARRELSIEDVQEIIRNEAKEIREALAVYKNIDTEKTSELELKLSALSDYIV